MNRRQFFTAFASVLLTRCTGIPTERVATKTPLPTETIPIVTNTPQPVTTDIPTITATSTATATPEPVPLREQIGQMLMIGFKGTTVTGNTIVQDIEENHIGGVFLFEVDYKGDTHNIANRPQVTQLVADLHNASAHPLLIGIDYEGGNVNRLPESKGFPETYSAEAIGQQDNASFTQKVAKEMAETLADLRINLNLAPVMDVNTNPDNPIIGQFERSFSEDVRKVTKHGRIFIEEHRQQGVLCALKHFPGHGSSTTDSHLGLVDVTDSWQDSELDPYRTLINEGNVDVIMTAHIFLRQFDADYPATLSKPILTDLLRKEMGYNGVIMTDDLLMKAIKDHYTTEDAVILAIQAGADILSFSNNFGEDIAVTTADQIIATIEQAVTDRLISKQRIWESYERIQKIKEKITIQIK